MPPQQHDLPELENRRSRLYHDLSQVGDNTAARSCRSRPCVDRGRDSERRGWPRLRTSRRLSAREMAGAPGGL